MNAPLLCENGIKAVVPTACACPDFLVMTVEGLIGFSKSSFIQYLPVELKFEGSPSIAAVVAGSNHVLALTTQGIVYAWGAGQQGQLGRRLPERRKLNGTKPERLALRKIVIIGAGSYHSLAVNQDGHVFGWGLNSMGQLGLGDQRDIAWAPTEIKALSVDTLRGARVVQIEGGEHHTLFLLDDGRVFGCGRIDNHQLGLGSNHPAMNTATAKESHCIHTPTEISFPPPPGTGEGTFNPIAHISTSGHSNMAASRSGHSYSWGFSNSSQLGLGPDIDDQPTPERIRWKNSEDWRVEGVMVGGQHCILLARRKEMPANAGQAVLCETS